MWSGRKCRRPRVQPIGRSHADQRPSGNGDTSDEDDQEREKEHVSSVKDVFHYHGLEYTAVLNDKYLWDCLLQIRGSGYPGPGL